MVYAYNVGSFNMCIIYTCLLLNKVPFSKMSYIHEALKLIRTKKNILRQAFMRERGDKELTAENYLISMGY